MSLVRTVLVAPIVAGLSFGALTCDSNSPSDAPRIGQTHGRFVILSPGCTTLWAGQTIDAGEVCISHDNTNLFIAYETTHGWGLEEVHAWVGASLSDMPATPSGNPKIGLFPYAGENLGGATTFAFTIPLDSLEVPCDTAFFAAAHAALSRSHGGGGTQTETGWADGDRFTNNGSWATYFQASVPCEPPDEDEPEQCETAYALGEQTFIDIGLTDSRWGWQLGPVGPGSYSSPLYAGAGQNDVTKGTEVGSLQVDYDGSTASVTYEMIPGYTLDETHVYVGTSAVATLAPGQLGHQHDLTNASSDTYVVSGFTGEDIFVVAHAVTCAGADAEPTDNP